jgi:hypothetical protein
VFGGEQFLSTSGLGSQLLVDVLGREYFFFYDFTFQLSVNFEPLNLIHISFLELCLKCNNLGQLEMLGYV